MSLKREIEYEVEPDEKTVIILCPYGGKCTVDFKVNSSGVVKEEETKFSFVNKLDDQ